MPDQMQAPSAQPDTEEAHDIAVEAEKAVELLATTLGQLGADAAAVEAVGKMADVIRQIASGLAKGMKEQEAAPAHSMDSAADEMMAERNAPGA